MRQLPAIDVTFVIDDSVVETHRVRAVRAPWLAWAAFGTALALWVAAAVAFTVGVQTAARNAQSMRDWTDTEGRSMYDFRPERLSIAYDYMAFGGLGGGTLAFALGLWVWRRDRQIAGFPPVIAGPDGFALQSDDGRRAPIPSDAPMRTRQGRAALVITPVDENDRVERIGRRLSLPGGNLGGYVAAVAVAVVVGAMIIDAVPPDPESLATLPSERTRFVRNEMVPTLRAAPTEPMPLEGEKPRVAMALEEGRMGTRSKTRNEPARAHRTAMAEARDAGLVGVFRTARADSSFATLMGTSMFSKGLDDRDAYDGLFAEELVEQQGGWGYALRGVGPGGGGTGWGTIGIGRYARPRAPDPGAMGLGTTGTGYG